VQHHLAVPVVHLAVVHQPHQLFVLRVHLGVLVGVMIQRNLQYVVLVIHHVQAQQKPLAVQVVIQRVQIQPKKAVLHVQQLVIKHVLLHVQFLVIVVVILAVKEDVTELVLQHVLQPVNI